jgi:signal transduction histidine kinase
VRREPTEIGVWLTTFGQEIQASVEARGITLRLEGIEGLGAAVALHTDTFRRTLLNLVQNAVEAMPQGGPDPARLADSGSALPRRP